MNGVAIKLSDSILHAFSSRNIYEEVIGRLFKVERAVNPDEPLYFYTRHESDRRNKEHLYEEKIQYFLFNKDMVLLDSGGNTSVEAAVGGVVRDRDDVLHYTGDAEMAKMLLVAGDIV